MRYLPFALAALLLASPALATDAPLPAATPTPQPAAVAPGAGAAPGAAEVPATGEAAAPVEETPPPSWVYMVVRVALAGNDITQVAFLRHPAITSLEACEQERPAGMMQGWRYYNRYYFKTLKGISYKIDFRCVEGQQYLAAWRPGDLLNRYYLVRTTDGKLVATPHDNFFACRRALARVTAAEGIDAFCGVASQPITQPPVEEAEPDAAAPATSGAPAGTTGPVAVPAPTTAPASPAVPAH